jgi:hypothetical protein
MLAVSTTARAQESSEIPFNPGAEDPLEEMPAERLSTEYLSKAELDATPKEVLAYLRNRIYANHGYNFKTKKWSEEFSRCGWYEPNPRFSEKLFNDYEKENLKRIIAAEKKKK